MKIIQRRDTGAPTPNTQPWQPQNHVGWESLWYEVDQQSILSSFTFQGLAYGRSLNQELTHNELTKNLFTHLGLKLQNSEYFKEPE